MDDLTSSPTPEEKPKMTLPVVFEKCPHCEGTKRLGISYFNQLRDEGLMHKDSFTAGLMHQIPLVDQAHPPAILAQMIKIKVLYIYWDVCADCGTMYCTKFEAKDMPAQVQMQQAPQAQRRSGMGFPPFARG